MVIIMILWIDNGAVLKSSSQWQLKEVWKLNNSVHELFIFKILLIAIDWNFWELHLYLSIKSKYMPYFKMVRMEFTCIL